LPVPGSNLRAGFPTLCPLSPCPICRTSACADNLRRGHTLFLLLVPCRTSSYGPIGKRPTPPSRTSDSQRENVLQLLAFCGQTLQFFSFSFPPIFALGIILFLLHRTDRKKSRALLSKLFSASGVRIPSSLLFSFLTFPSMGSALPGMDRVKFPFFY